MAPDPNQGGFSPGDLLFILGDTWDMLKIVVILIAVIMVGILLFNQWLNRSGHHVTGV